MPDRRYPRSFSALEFRTREFRNNKEMSNAWNTNVESRGRCGIVLQPDAGAGARWRGRTERRRTDAATGSGKRGELAIDGATATNGRCKRDEQRSGDGQGVREEGAGRQYGRGADGPACTAEEQ